MVDETDYRVDLDIYRGPLDLLLHLIREREVEIHEIPIAEICDQFLAHLEIVKRIDIDRAGEFVLMAATLMLIKSRMLLPQAAGPEDEDDDFDPRTDLVRQLLEYKQFKDVSQGLAIGQRERRRKFGGGVEVPAGEGPDAGKLLEDVGVHDLYLAFERMMRETLSEIGHEVHSEELPVREIMAEVEQRIRDAGGALVFRGLFTDRRDRLYIVTVFLALLELLRLRRIALGSGDDVVNVRIELRSDSPESPDSPGPPLRDAVRPPAP